MRYWSLTKYIRSFTLFNAIEVGLGLVERLILSILSFPLKNEIFIYLNYAQHFIQQHVIILLHFSFSRVWLVISKDTSLFLASSKHKGSILEKNLACSFVRTGCFFEVSVEEKKPVLLYRLLPSSWLCDPPCAYRIFCPWPSVRHCKYIIWKV